LADELATSRVLKRKWSTVWWTTLLVRLLGSRGVPRAIVEFPEVPWLILVAFGKPMYTDCADLVLPMNRRTPSRMASALPASLRASHGRPFLVKSMHPGLQLM
jgi:hypothetical protein